jgi:hypothetical protein
MLPGERATPNSNHFPDGTNEADGELMPAYKDQTPPDLHYFPQSRK